MNLTRAVLAWLAIALAETVHGILRQWLLVPAVGAAVARPIGVVVGCAIILAIAVASVRWIGVATTRSQLQLGLLWLLLMLAFEFGLGLALGYPLTRMLAEYDPRAGGLMAFGMLFLLLSPCLAARMRRHAAAAGR
jgi:hypothetical protein